jgi:hypothetical protein
MMLPNRTVELNGGGAIGGSPYLPKEADMVNLTKDEVKALGHAVGLEIRDPELTEVTHSLNAVLDALDTLDAINPPGLENIEPLPIILPNISERPLG